MEVKIEKCAEEELGAVSLWLNQVFRGEGFGTANSRQKLSKLDVHIHDPNRVQVVFGIFDMLQRLKFHLLFVVPGNS